MKLIRYSMIATLALNLSAGLFAQQPAEMRKEDKFRIKEAMNIAARYGEKIWKGFNNPPFVVLLVTDSTEFLVNHPAPSKDFLLAGHDDILGTTIWYRKTKLNPHFLATFNAVGPVPCIVVGTPENTGKNSTEWIITLLHEHFHQYQYTSPGYYTALEELDLAGGDQTGMWMLNYKFPYDSLPVIRQYELYTQALSALLKSNKKKQTRAAVKQFRTQREKLKENLPAAAYRYFSFQLWQEGIARYTEYKFLELLEKYTPAKEILALPDYRSFAAMKTKMYNTELANLLDNKIKDAKRVCFYSIGFAEGLLLDRSGMQWRKKYLSDKFFLDKK